MNKSVICQELFTFDGDIFKNLFASFEYPWEILPHLKDIVRVLVDSELDGYERVGDVLIGKEASIAASAHIDGPAVIGAGCEIRHCAYIRGSVILGDGCVIGNSSEVKNSILMDGAQAPHFNYVGDSILGKRAHLGAGAVCSNLRSDGKSVRIKTVNGTSLDTRLRKLGAILGDGVEVGCGAVLCPGTVIGALTDVYPLTVTRGTYPAHSIVKDTYTTVPKIRTAQ